MCVLHGILYTSVLFDHYSSRIKYEMYAVWASEALYPLANPLRDTGLKRRGLKNCFEASDMCENRSA